MYICKILSLYLVLSLGGDLNHRSSQGSCFKIYCVTKSPAFPSPASSVLWTNSLLHDSLPYKRVRSCVSTVSWFQMTTLKLFIIQSCVQLEHICQKNIIKKARMCFLTGKICALFPVWIHRLFVVFVSALLKLLSYIIHLSLKILLFFEKLPLFLRES